jgi:hypothetical protein
VQIPNLGSVSRRAKRDIFDFSPRVGAVGGYFATVSSITKESAPLLKGPWKQ